LIQAGLHFPAAVPGWWGPAALRGLVRRFGAGMISGASGNRRLEHLIQKMSGSKR
jgi:hypothetical protein